MNHIIFPGDASYVPEEFTQSPQSQAPNIAKRYDRPYVPQYIANHRWYMTLKGEKGLYHNLTSSNNLIICFNPYPDVHVFSAFADYFEFYEYQKRFKPDKRCFHEVIDSSRPHKIHFDLDVTLESVTEEKLVEIGNTSIQLLLNTLARHAPKVLPEDVFLFSSHSNVKRSYHVIVDNHYLEDNECYRYLFTKISQDIHCPYLDVGTQSKSHNLRVYGSTKPESLRPKVLEKSFQWKGKTVVMPEMEEVHILAASLVTFTSTCQLLSVPRMIKKTYTSAALSTPAVERALALLEPDTFVATGVTGSIISLRRLKPSFCICCQREHEKENPYLLIIGDEVHMNCRRTNNRARLGVLGEVIQVSCEKEVGYFSLTPETEETEEAEEVRGLREEAVIASIRETEDKTNDLNSLMQLARGRSSAPTPATITRARISWSGKPNTSLVSGRKRYLPSGNW